MGRWRWRGGRRGRALRRGRAVRRGRGGGRGRRRRAGRGGDGRFGGGPLGCRGRFRALGGRRLCACDLFEGRRFCRERPLGRGGTRSLGVRLGRRGRFVGRSLRGRVHDRGECERAYKCYAQERRSQHARAPERRPRCAARYAARTHPGRHTSTPNQESRCSGMSPPQRTRKDRIRREGRTGGDRQNTNGNGRAFAFVSPPPASSLLGSIRPGRLPAKSCSAGAWHAWLTFRRRDAATGRRENRSPCARTLG